MNEEKNKQLGRELCLDLIYLTAWKEETLGDESDMRAWKGYDFGTPDQLKEEGLIDFSYKAKSLYLTEEGEEKARSILKKLDQL